MIIDGRKIGQRILGEVKEKLRKSGKSLQLAAVLVGESTELKKFVELKKKAAGEIGVECEIYEYGEDIDENLLKKELDKITASETIHGVIIELPLPENLNTRELLNIIPQEKDVDVLSQKSQDNFYANKSEILPPAVEAVRQIFEEYKINPKGKKAVVFGQGLLVGKPVGHWLKNQGADVSVVDEFTKEPEKISKEADIIISGVGPIRGKDTLRVLAASNRVNRHLITEDMVKEGAIVVDFGKDVDFENVSKKVGLITPPAGGVGPIVVAAVLKNLVELRAP